MNDHDAPDPYPESTRLLAAREESQPIGEFLESGPYELGRWVPCQQWHQDGWECGQGEHFQPVRKSIETVLAEYFGIDMVKVEAERRAMLAALNNRDDLTPRPTQQQRRLDERALLFCSSEGLDHLVGKRSIQVQQHWNGEDDQGADPTCDARPQG